jgi:hypothetical protein
LAYATDFARRCANDEKICISPFSNKNLFFFTLSIYLHLNIGFVNGKSIFFIEILNESTFYRQKVIFSEKKIRQSAGCRPESKLLSITSIKTTQPVLLPFWA